MWCPFWCPLRTPTPQSPCRSSGSGWRRGSESNGVFTDCQPQYPDLQGYFNTGFRVIQAVFNTTRPLPDLTRHIHPYYSVIEEIVEGFVEGFWPALASRRLSAFLLSRGQARVPKSEQPGQGTSLRSYVPCDKSKRPNAEDMATP